MAGAGLLGITYALFANGTKSQRMAVAGVQLAIPRPSAGSAALVTPDPGTARSHFSTRPAGAGGATSKKESGPGFIQAVRSSGQKQIDGLVRRANFVINQQRSDSLTSLLTESGIALGIMALLSIGLGWLLAGRALGPLRLMNLRARRITEDTLHERLGLDGRQDELGELAATFDAVLARLERAFDSQRRFVANASHELRTPVTLERALLEVALADPDATVASLRHTCERVLAAGEQQERVIDALLTLARGQAGIEAPRPVRLDELVRSLMEERAEQLAGMRVDRVLVPVTVSGDPALLERLVSNLLDNAIIHIDPADPWLSVEVRPWEGRAELRLANSGAVVAPGQVDELFEPFRRLAGERTARDGLGLGLSIVRAVAVAHGGQASARPVDGGGLELTVRLAGLSSQPERQGALPTLCLRCQHRRSPRRFGSHSSMTTAVC